MREPLVHFVAAGAILFGIDAWRTPAPAPPEQPSATPRVTAPQETTTISVTGDVIAMLTDTAARRFGRTPTPAEVAGEVERWIDEEVLYREALARGLERDDPVIRERIASRMRYVLEQAANVPEPSDAELRAWFDAHRERWAVPERIDFTHVFVAGRDDAAAVRIDQLAAALAAGAPPETLGDPFSGGRRYRGRRVADLAQIFGDEMVFGLASQPIATWQRRRSRYGMHLVRVDKVEPARDADFAAARLDVRKAWRDARAGSELAAAVQRLRARWQVVRP